MHRRVRSRTYARESPFLIRAGACEAIHDVVIILVGNLRISAYVPLAIVKRLTVKIDEFPGNRVGRDEFDRFKIVRFLPGGNDESSIPMAFGISPRFNIRIITRRGMQRQLD